MKQLEIKPVLVTEVSQALSSTNGVDELLDVFITVYRFINECCPCSAPFKIEKVTTESLHFNAFYQSGLDMSRHAISVCHVEYKINLWTDEGRWVLDDEYLKIEEIADHLANNPVITQYPENIRELKKLLENGCWQFKPDLFPKFCENAPADLEEVLSWDKKYILTGTSKENMSIMTRDEWGELSDRQNRW